jgi:hypothetical protein
MSEHKIVPDKEIKLNSSIYYDNKLLKIHDYFNIITLPLIFVSNWIQLLFGNIFGFDYLFYLFLIYILLDLVWLIWKPKSVGSPGVIIFHHVITSVGWVITVSQPDLAYLAKLALLVEFNTWFNILRRYYKTDFLYTCFYVTWFLFRVVLYPILFLQSYKKYILYCTIYNSYFNMALPIFVICVSLSILNIIWTYELVIKKGYLGVTNKKN